MAQEGCWHGDICCGLIFLIMRCGAGVWGRGKCRGKKQFSNTLWPGRLSVHRFIKNLHHHPVQRILIHIKLLKWGMDTQDKRGGKRGCDIGGQIV